MRMSTTATIERTCVRNKTSKQNLKRSPTLIETSSACVLISFEEEVAKMRLLSGIALQSSGSPSWRRAKKPKIRVKEPR